MTWTHHFMLAFAFDSLSWAPSAPLLRWRAISDRSPADSLRYQASIGVAQEAAGLAVEYLKKGAGAVKGKSKL